MSGLGCYDLPMRSSHPSNCSDAGESRTEASSQNRETIFPGSIHGTEQELSSRLETQADRVAAHFDQPPSSELGVAARVALLALDALYLGEVDAEPDHYLCVGRHTEASLRSACSASLSLRHVLLIPRPVDGARMQLDVVPLGPTMAVAPWSQPLPVALAQRCTAIVLGDSLLLVSGVADRKPESMPNLAAPTTKHLERTTRDAPAPRRVENALRTRVSSIHDLLSLRPDDQPTGPLALEVRSQDAAVTIHLREDWLGQGLVLGRSELKCSHAALAAVLKDERVSRCHVFLRREDDAVVFYDTASTAGIFVGEEQVRRIAIPAPLNVLAFGADPEARSASVNPRRVVLQLTHEVSVTLLATQASA
jgi:hypothetical protein